MSPRSPSSRRRTASVGSSRTRTTPRSPGRRWRKRCWDERGSGAQDREAQEDLLQRALGAGRGLAGGRGGTVLWVAGAERGGGEQTPKKRCEPWPPRLRGCGGGRG